MKFLIDECRHISLVSTATDQGHEAYHVNWSGRSGKTDWDLMPKIVADGLIFVTNNARDFRKLFAREPVHAGRRIIVPQVTPSLQRELFSLVLSELDSVAALLNEAIEVTIEDCDLDFIAGSDVGGPQNGLLKFPIYSCHDVFIARAQHPLAQKQGLRLKDLQKFTWMAPKSRPADAALINDAFARAGLAGPSRFIWTDAPMVGTHLLMMDDIVFMTSPAMVIGRLMSRDNAIVMLDIQEPRVERRAALIYPDRTRLNPSAMLLMDAVRTAAHHQIGELSYATPLNVEQPL